MPNLEEIWANNLNSLLKEAEEGNEGAAEAIRSHYRSTLLEQAEQLGGTEEDVQKTFDYVLRNLKLLQNKGLFEIYLKQTLQMVIDTRKTIPQPVTEQPPVRDTPPVQPEKPVPKKKKKKGWLSALLVIAVLLAAGTAGYIFGIPKAQETLYAEAAERFENGEYEKAAQAYMYAARLASLKMDDENRKLADYGYYKAVYEQIQPKKEYADQLELANRYLKKYSTPRLKEYRDSIYNMQYRQIRYDNIRYYENGTISETVSEYEYDSDGNQVGYTRTNDGEKTIYSYTFNEDGTITEMIQENPDGSTSRTVYSLDEQGNRTGYTAYADGRIESRAKYFLDEDGKILESTLYNTDGTYLTKTEYERYPNGNLKEYRFYLGNGDELCLYMHNRYNAIGQPEELTYYRYMSDEISSRRVYTYNALGRQEKMDLYDEYAEYVNTVDVFEYDSEDEKLIGKTTYDDSGNRIAEGKIDYDEKGHRKEMNMYDADGNLTEHTAYEWDDAGLPLRTTVADGEGNLQSVTEYEYEFIPFKQK